MRNLHQVASSVLNPDNGLLGHSLILFLCVSLPLMDVSCPWDDLTLFDWVLAAGSTLAAAQVLGLPQSTVSRRFRSFNRAHRLKVARRQGSLHLLSEHSYVQALRLVARQFRCRHGLCCIGLLASSESVARFSDLLPGRLICLDSVLWAELGQFFSDGILDLAFVPGRRDELDELPFLMPKNDKVIGSYEHEGLLAFRRRFFLEAQRLSIDAPPVAPGG